MLQVVTANHIVSMGLNELLSIGQQIFLIYRSTVGVNLSINIKWHIKYLLIFLSPVKNNQSPVPIIPFPL